MSAVRQNEQERRHDSDTPTRKPVTSENYRYPINFDRSFDEGKNFRENQISASQSAHECGSNSQKLSASSRSNDSEEYVLHHSLSFHP